MDYVSSGDAAFADEARGPKTIQTLHEQTELTSLLSTCTDQAFEIRRLTAVILDRISPQGHGDESEEQDFSGGYIGMAERLRSTQCETIKTLTVLSKLA